MKLHRPIRVDRKSPPSAPVTVWLRLLGVPAAQLYKAGWSETDRRRMRGGFWARSEAHLLDLLYVARDCWRRAVRRAHPDRGGSNEAFAEVNNAWACTRQIFKRRGYELP